MVVCAATAKQSPSKRHLPLRWNHIDLERNSADAIAPAMTSSVPLAHRSAVGTSPKPRRNPAERHYPGFACESLNPDHGPKGGSVQLGAHIPASAVTSAASVFGGGNPSVRSLRERPGITMWKRRVLPTSCGCQEENAIYGILLRFPENRKSNWRACSSHLNCILTVWGVQCQFSVQRSEWL